MDDARLFGLVALLAILLWILPGSGMLSPRQRDLAQKAAGVVLAVGLLIALVRAAAHFLS
jgi:hypothetical protein